MGSGHQVTALYEIVPVGVHIDLPGVDKSKYAAAPKLDPKAANEWLTVKMRYKHPEAETSKELSRALPADALNNAPSSDFRFASSVAAFAMMLQDSKWRGAMTYPGVLEEAKRSVGKDVGGHRQEFIKLVERARGLAAKPEPESVLGGRN
jgi:Ca-activated chloride channel family protein